MKKVNKIHVNLSVDPEKKAIFESLQHIHGKTFSDLFDEALDNIIGDLAPDIILEMQIREVENKLAEMKENLVEAKFISKQRQARQKVENVPIINTDLELMRETKYQNSKSSMVNQYKKNLIDWKRIAEVFEFPNTTDAKLYILSKLKDENLI